MIELRVKITLATKTIFFIFTSFLSTVFVCHLPEDNVFIILEIRETVEEFEPGDLFVLFKGCPGELVEVAEFLQTEE